MESVNMKGPKPSINTRLQRGLCGMFSPRRLDKSERKRVAPDRYRAKPVSARSVDEDVIARLRDDVIGSDALIDTPFGQRTLVYCDYVASGRALKSIERFIHKHVLPTYANTHTEASLTGRRTNFLREQARRTIANTCGVDAESHAVVFAGSGATSAIDVAVRLLPDPFVPLGFPSRDSEACKRPAVITGPYEHHSNILPWRESNADVFELSMEKDSAVVNMEELRSVLEQVKGKQASSPPLLSSNYLFYIAGHYQRQMAFRTLVIERF
jgi:selenocysteine lyase/cysteine desulfurase